MTHQTTTILDLPREIRQQVFRYIYQDITINSEPGPWNPPGLRIRDIIKGIKDWRFNDDYDEEYYEDLRRRYHHPETEDKQRYPQPDYDDFRPPLRGPAQSPKTPMEIIRLRLVCSAFATDVTNFAWHTTVTYRFSSTLALLDVLCGWSQARLRSVRHICLLATMITLCPRGTDQECSYYFKDTLKLLSGLKLDTLIVEDSTLRYYGHNTYHEGNDELAAEFAQLLTSSGWKDLYHVCRCLHFSENLYEKIDVLVRQNRETDFTYHIERTLPDPGWELDPETVASLAVSLPVIHKQLTKNDDDFRGLRDVQRYLFLPEGTRYRTIVRARRGRTAKYIETGDHPNEKQAQLCDLTKNQTWRQARQISRYFKSEGTSEWGYLQYHRSDPDLSFLHGLTGSFDSDD